MVLEGLRREMGPVRGAFQMEPQSLGLAVIDVGDPASVPLLCCPQSLFILVIINTKGN